MATLETEPAVTLRDPDTVMKLARMGSFHQSRLSFMRILLRRLKAENWTFDRPVFEFDARGVGHAVYSAHGPTHSYSLIAFGHDLPPEKRSDRVIATEWDATFTLFDGIPTADDIDRLRGNIPKQEAGRVSDKELSVSRANRSARLWEHVVDCLSKGQQPDADTVQAVGYLMRTTAVYGSGKLGAADREKTAARPEFQPPFQIEMLSVFLTRAFVMDLVEHMAKLRAPGTAVPLDPALRRSFGIGNSTGLGMAPYLLNHPALLNNWIAARETALARVRSIRTATPDSVARFRQFLTRARINARLWQSDHPMQQDRLTRLRTDLDRLADHIDAFPIAGNQPWNALWLWAETALGLEAQEQLVSLLLEPHGALVDDLAETMSADEDQHFAIDGAVSTSQVRALLENAYGWALEIDWTAAEQQARIWYTSEEKLEPRLGERTEPDIADYAQPLAPGRDAAAFYAALRTAPDEPIAAFVLRHPEHRHILRRAQITARCPYAEIRDNTISATMMPIDLLRAKLSFFGAIHFDPRSDRWVRINMFRNAPFPGDLADQDADDWTYPPLMDAAE